MRVRHCLLLCLFIVFLSSCSTIAERFPGVYAIDVNQGNIIDQDMIDQLRPNMNKRQVQFILGSPMLIDVFHQNRWDYIYSQQKGGGERMQSRISLFFQNENLVGVQGDYKPSEFAVPMPSKEQTVDVPKRPEEKTVFGEVANFFSGDDSPEAVAEEAENEEIQSDSAGKEDSHATEPGADLPETAVPVEPEMRPAEDVPVTDAEDG